MTTWYSIDDGSATPLHGAEVVVAETSTLTVTGLETGDELILGGTRTFPAANGTVIVRLAHLQAIGLTSASVWRGRRDIARATVEILPGKVRQAEFDVLWRELHEVWVDLLFRARSSIRAVERRADPGSLWRGARPLVESICAYPQTQLVRGRSTAPYARARNVDFTPSRKLVMGAALQDELPTRPVIGSADIPANRLIARFCDAVATAAERAGNAVVAADARRMRDHPTLRELRADAFPSPDAVVAKDQRYLRCWHALRRLASPATSNTTGPFPDPIGLIRLSALYEYWVFMKVVIGVELILGAPLDEGYAAFGRDRGGDRRELRLEPGTRLDFRGGVSVHYEPVIGRADPSTRAGGFDLRVPPFEVDRERAPVHVTPDVVVSGPAGILVLDAKYVGEQDLASKSQKLHARYGGIHRRNDPQGLCREVIVVHPGRDTTVEFAGHAALPMTPGHPTEWLKPRLRRSVLGW
ncbi:hypothetical protein NB037_05170 [Rathayibacter sp. ZW T2_19]|uniref:DUF2357 domain-containing protein n=1 Tax=Rathayibacter rubneri TaxID=2950106 RepID=A0A9X2DVB0_9MICO|nr:hypothetical protein [Rathayibacter rubneri]MCM6761805.1 hypothetical protein [Rathayibacter rubneri]